METKHLFNFQSCLGDLISGTGTIQNFDGRSFWVLVLSPIVFGSQFDFFIEFVGHLIVFPWVRKDFS